uniref:Uncharacterized protein n=1 Tax=Rhizophora mucronata TaxID=61149 RepID=A0A2P2KY96_RHIMU
MPAIFWRAEVTEPK